MQRVEFTVHEDWADLLVEAAREYFKESGFETSLSLPRITGESVYQFTDGDAVVCLEEKKLGDDMRTLILSSESKTVDVEAVQIGAFHLFAEAVYRVLMRAIPSKDGKKKFIAWLRQALKEAEKEP